MTGYLMTAVNAFGLTIIIVIIVDVRHCPIHGAEGRASDFVMYVADDSQLVMYG